MPESWVAPTSPPFATLCGRSVFRTHVWSGETFAVTRTCHCAPEARPPMGPGPRPRTSTRFGRLSVLSCMKSAGKRPFWLEAAASPKKPGTGTRTPGSPRRGAPSQTLMTTGISRSLTYFPWKRTLTGSKHSKRHFPRAPSTCVVDCGLSGDSVTSISRPLSTQG